MLSKLSYRILRILDEKTLAKYLNFEQYFSFHKFFGFPLKTLGFFYTHGYRLDLKNPITFNEKIVYRQLFERNPLLPMIVDKYAVRKYVKEKVGEKYLIPLLQIADSFDDIHFSQLPDEYIMKMNHASGRNIIFKKGNLISKKGMKNNGYDREELKRTIDTWFAEKYRLQELIWFVQPIKRKIIIEKLLEDNDGKIPKDYKFFVFDGKVEFILVIHDRFSEYTENLYDRDWQVSGFTFADPTGLVEEKPILLNELINVAEKLASEFTSMRVDLYTFGSDIYFGELTPCHANAHDTFIPVKYDEYYGIKWKNHTNLINHPIKNGLTP